MVITNESIQEQNEEGMESGKASREANPCLSGLEAGPLNQEDKQDDEIDNSKIITCSILEPG